MKPYYKNKILIYDLENSLKLLQKNRFETCTKSSKQSLMIETFPSDTTE